MYGCLFQSSGISSEREVNSGVRSYIAESTTRGSDFKTLIYELDYYYVSTLYIYHNWSRRELV